MGPLAELTLVEAIDPDAPQALHLAAGLAGRMAADLGARVVRVTARDDDRVGEGQGDGAGVGGAAALPVALGLGKQVLRCRREQWRELAREVAVGAGVVLADKTGREAIGAGGGASSALQLLLTMTADDTQGPESELTLEARSGLLDIVGDPARAPLRLGGHQVAYAGGLAAFLAMVSGLVRRPPADPHGAPAPPIRVNLLDVAVWLNWKTLGLVEIAGLTPTRAGLGADWVVLACADGFVASVFRFNEWAPLKAALSDPRLEDVRFATPAGRRANARALNVILGENYARFTRAELKALSVAHRLPLGPVWTPEELLADPHMMARQVFHRVAGAGKDGADAHVPRLPVRWNGEAFTPGVPEHEIEREIGLERLRDGWRAPR